jgi:WD40 repeat protein/serine/threonine protein kinase
MPDDSVLLGNLAEEFTARVRTGQLPEVEEYARNHPALAARIRALFPALLLLEGLAGAGVHCAAPGEETGPPGTNAVLGLTPGAIFGNYRIGREVGRGGMGVVFEAVHLPLSKRVALKVLPVHGPGEASRLERFLREAQTGAGLHHTNIVPVFDIGQVSGTPYFAMQYIEGKGLDQVLRDLQPDEATQPGPPPAAAQASSGPVPNSNPKESIAKQSAGCAVAPEENYLPDPRTRPSEFFGRVAELALQAARGLAHAHQRGVIHRDIKPSNLLLDNQGVLWITDFGLARRTDDPSLTRTGAVVGTPRYMSPEQAEASRHAVDHRTDIYSLGATLYELLTRRPAVTGRTPDEMLTQILTREPVAPRRVDPGIPRDLETLCLKCLQKDPRGRYPSAAELAADLERFLAGEPVKARPVGYAERLWRWCVRNPTLASVGALAGGALLAIAVLATVFAVHAYRAADQHEQDARHLRLEKLQTQTALRTAQQQRGLAREHSRLAEQRLAENYLERAAAALKNDDDPSQGLLFLSRAYQVVSPEPSELRRTIGVNLTAWPREVHPLKGIFSREDGFTAVAVSPKGQMVLTANTDKTARLWSLATGEPLGPTLRHASNLTAVAFSSDGRTLATACEDGTAFLWSAATGKRFGSPLRHQNPVYAVKFSPQGRTVLTHCLYGTARLWSAATGEPLGPTMHHHTGIVAAQFSPDGTVVLTHSHDGLARLWSGTTGRVIGSPLRHQHGLAAAAFSPDGKMLVTACGTEARLWDGTTGRARGAPLRHQERVHYVAFSPDGKTLLTLVGLRSDFFDLEIPKNAKDTKRPAQEKGQGVPEMTTNEKVWLWSVADGRALGPFPGQSSRAYAAAFSPDGKTVFTADGKIRLLDMKTRKPVGAPLAGPNPIVALAVSPDGKTVLGGSGDGTARLWDIASGAMRGLPLQCQGLVTSVEFSPDGRTVITRSKENDSEDLFITDFWESTEGRRDGPWLETRFWSMAPGKAFGPSLRHEGAIHDVAFGPDGKIVLTGGADKTARLWSASTGKPLGDPLTHSGKVHAVAFSPDGKAVATRSYPGSFRLWSLQTGKHLSLPLHVQGQADIHTPLPLHLYPRRITGVAFSSDGKFIRAICHVIRVTATLVDKHALRTYRLWRTSTGKSLGVPIQKCRDVEFGHAGKTILTRTLEGSVRLWSVAAGSDPGPLLRLENPGSIFLNPDRRWLLTDKDRTARLWSLTTGKPAGGPLTHSGKVIALGPDNQTVLVSSLENSRTQLWSLATGKPFGESMPLPPNTVLGVVHFSPDGKKILTENRRFMDVPSRKLPRLWSAVTGKAIGQQLGDVTDIWSAKFSPDSKALVVWYRNGMGQLFSATTGGPIGPRQSYIGKTLKGYEFYDPPVEMGENHFSPDGKTFLTLQGDKVQIWSSQTGKPVARPLWHKGRVLAVAFSPDGKTLVTGSDDQTARLWTAATGKSLGSPLRHRGAVTNVAFRADGTAVLTASLDGTARVWSASTGTALGSPLLHSDGLMSAKFSPDGMTVLTGTLDGTGRLWSATTGKALSPPVRHEGKIVDLQFSPDGQIVLTKSMKQTPALRSGKFSIADGVLHPLGSEGVILESTLLWSAATGKLLAPTPTRHLKASLIVNISPDGKTGLAHHPSQEWLAPRLISMDTGKAIGAPLRHPNWVEAAEFAPDSRTLLTHVGGNRAYLWSALTGLAIGKPLWHADKIRAMVYGPDGKTFVTASGKEVRLWSAKTGKALGSALGHRGYVSVVAFGPDGKTLVAVAGSASVKNEDGEDDEDDETKTLASKGRDSQKDNGTYVVEDSDTYADDDPLASREVWVWSVDTCKPLGPPLRFPCRVTAVAFSPDGKRLVTGGADGTARLWELPQPTNLDTDHVQLWVQVLTGAELDSHGVQRLLDAKTWRDRRRQLRKCEDAFRR